MIARGKMDSCLVAADDNTLYLWGGKLSAEILSSEVSVRIGVCDVQMASYWNASVCSKFADLFPAVCYTYPCDTSACGKPNEPSCCTRDATGYLDDLDVYVFSATTNDWTRKPVVWEMIDRYELSYAATAQCFMRNGKLVVGGGPLGNIWEIDVSLSSPITAVKKTGYNLTNDVGEDMSLVAYTLVYDNTIDPDMLYLVGGLSFVYVHYVIIRHVLVQIIHTM